MVGVLQNIDFAQLTDIGRVRKYNEDYVAYHIPLANSPERRFGALFIVADGIGSLGGGEVASQSASDSFVEAYYAPDLPDEDIFDRIRYAIGKANDTVRSRSEGLNLPKIGTTIAGMVVMDSGECYIFNVGDSRVYLLFDNTIEQLTQDTAIPGMKNAPLTAYIGQAGYPQPVLFKLDNLSLGHTLLICSDGLFKTMDEAEMFNFIRKRSAGQAVQKMMQTALERGAPDNVSITVVRHGAPPRAVSPLLIVAALVVLIAVIVGGVLFFANGQADSGVSIAESTLDAETNVAVALAAQAQAETATAEAAAAFALIETPLLSETIESGESPTEEAIETATETATATDEPTATSTVTASATSTNTATATATATDEPTATSTVTASATNTNTATATVTSSATATATPTSTATATATITQTPTSTATILTEREAIIQTRNAAQTETAEADSAAAEVTVLEDDAQTQTPTPQPTATPIVAFTDEDILLFAQDGGVYFPEDEIRVLLELVAGNSNRTPYTLTTSISNRIKLLSLQTATIDGQTYYDDAWCYLSLRDQNPPRCVVPESALVAAVAVPAPPYGEAVNNAMMCPSPQDCGQGGIELREGEYLEVFAYVEFELLVTTTPTPRPTRPPATVTPTPPRAQPQPQQQQQQQPQQPPPSGGGDPAPPPAATNTPDIPPTDVVPPVDPPEDPPPPPEDPPPPPEDPPEDPPDGGNTWGNVFAKLVNSAQAATRTPAPTRTPTITPSPTPTATATATATATFTPTVNPRLMTLRVRWYAVRSSTSNQVGWVIDYQLDVFNEPLVPLALDVNTVFDNVPD